MSGFPPFGPLSCSQYYFMQISTPKTDSKSSDHIGFWSCATVPSEFARELEREITSHQHTITLLEKEIIGLTEERANWRMSSVCRELERENARLLDVCERAMTYGLNGSKCYSAREACKVGDDMRDILANAPSDRMAGWNVGGPK